MVSLLQMLVLFNLCSTAYNCEPVCDKGSKTDLNIMDVIGYVLRFRPKRYSPIDGSERLFAVCSIFTAKAGALNSGCRRDADFKGSMPALASNILTSHLSSTLPPSIYFVTATHFRCSWKYAQFPFPFQIVWKFYAPWSIDTGWNFLRGQSVYLNQFSALL